MLHGCNHIAIDYAPVTSTGPAGLMLITFSEITFLTLYSLVTGTHYKNNLMKCNLLESLQSWGWRGGRHELRRKARVESIMLKCPGIRS